jgi:putative ABC transport system ATP-binding protein
LASNFIASMPSRTEPLTPDFAQWHGHAVEWKSPDSGRRAFRRMDLWHRRTALPGKVMRPRVRHEPTPRWTHRMNTISNSNAAQIPPLIALRGVGKQFSGGAAAFTALADIDLNIARGEFVVVVGQSGSGKSTLLNLLAGIDRPSSGEIHIDDQPLHTLSERALSAWRGRAVGIVFQFFQLLPTLTAAENVMLPMDFCHQWPSRERRARAMALLQQLGVADQADKFPAALSGGQQQRVAVARALANAPAILLADEPTGNLDSRNADALLGILSALAESGQTIVMVTHERSAMRQARRTVTLVDGRITSDSGQAHA